MIDEHGRPVLLEIRMANAGGVLGGLMDALAPSVSLGLHRGVLLSAYVERLALARLKHKACLDIRHARGLDKTRFLHLALESL